MSQGANDETILKGVRHIGIAVKNSEAAIKLFSSLFSAKLIETITSQEHGLKLTFLQVAGVNVELLEPIRPDVPVAKFLETRGEGFHHIAFEVTDIQRVLVDLKKAGVKLVDEVPRRGAHGGLIAFVHPSSTHGVMIELTQPVDKGQS